MSQELEGAGSAESVGDIEFTFDGHRVRAPRGQSVAMALWQSNAMALRNSSKLGEPRGILCNMGICYECLVHVNGESVRACMTEVRDGMVVERGGRP